MGVPFTVKSATLSHRGRKRSNNEDFVALFEPKEAEDLRRRGRAFIVADGVGGASKGERASEYAAQKVIYDFFSDRGDDLATALRRAIRQAGNDIFDHANKAEGIGRMATTIVVAVVREGILTVANVGDSRAYLVRNGDAKQISRDHTIAGELVREGEITEHEAMHFRGKNRLTRSLGGEPDVQVEVSSDIPLGIGDRVLLCSDGLSRYTTVADIARLAGDGEPDTISRRCVEFAIEQGGADNVSVAVIEVVGAVDAPLPALLEADEMLTQPSLRPRRRRKRTLRDWARIVLALGGLGTLSLAGYLILGGLGQSPPDLSNRGTAEGALVTQAGNSTGPTLLSSETVAGPLDATEEPARTGEVPTAQQGDKEIEAFVEELALSPPFATIDFSDPAEWEMPNEPVATGLVQDTALLITDNMSDDLVSWGIGSEADLTDFFVQVTAQVIPPCSGRDGYGLVARIGPSGNPGYALDISCDGFLRVRKFLESGALILLDWTSEEAIRPGTESNRVGLLIRGPEIYAFANGRILGEVEDSAYVSGPVGLYARSAQTPSLEVRFEELQIWRLE